MRRIYLLLFPVLLAVWLLACALAPEPEVDVPPPVPWQPSATPTAVPATSTATAAPNLTPTSTPTPVPEPTLLPTLTPTPTPGALEAPDSAYAVAHETEVDGYTVRLWRKARDQQSDYDGIATISRGDQLLARVDHAFDLSAETGEDLTGEGHPDVVVQAFTGGAHCCFSTVVYDLGETARKVLETPLSNCDGIFEDLDDDGVFEYITCDDLFAYAYCPYAFSPAVRVVLRYDGEKGYVPASPEYASLYEQDIALDTELTGRDDTAGWDGTKKCAVLPLVLDYLYTARPQDAWDALVTHYAEADRDLLWTEVVSAVTGSPLYAPGEAPVDLRAPSYYMLQLLTNCDPPQQVIGVVPEGQDPCGPDAARRDLFWLEGHLQRVGLVGEREMLVLAPQGCTTDCQLDVVRMSDNERRGSIRLDTTAGFPGEVYRVNGEESEHWRLLGDLTWERVPE